MMAFAHDMSCECTKSELDLFSVPPTQTSMEHGSWVEYHPVTTVTDGSPIEFDGRTISYPKIDFQRRFPSIHWNSPYYPTARCVFISFLIKNKDIDKIFRTSPKTKIEWKGAVI